jgi:uncharacterized membrane protein (TIGR02234 family)
LDPYWQVKAVAVAPAPGIPPVPGTPIGPTVGAPVKPPKGSAGMLGNIATLLVLLGGAVAAYASTAPWVVTELSGVKGVDDVERSFKGISTWQGKVALALGLVCIVAGILAIVRKDAGPLKGMIVPGLGILAVVGYTVVNVQSIFTEDLVADAMVRGMSQEAARGQVTTWLDSGQITLTTESMLYVLAGAGSVILIGAILAFLARKPAPRSGAGTAAGF